MVLPSQRKEGKKLRWQDGVRAIATLIKIRFSPYSKLFDSPTSDDYHVKRRDELARQHPLT